MRPQIVRLQRVEVIGGEEHVVMGNAAGEYTLVGNLGQKTCITPTPGTDYFLFAGKERWKWLGAENYVSLDFYTDWTGSYTNQTNVAIVPVQKGSNGLWSSTGDWGIFWVQLWQNNSRNQRP
jgi:hypothetical protein